MNALKSFPVAIFFTFTFLFLHSSLAQEGTKVGFRLDEIDGLGRVVLNEEARRMLARQGFVILPSGEAYIYGFYENTSLPAFITCDSCWAGYAALLERTLSAVEEVQACLLRGFSFRLFHLLLEKKGDPLFRDLLLFAGVGAALQDRSVLNGVPRDVEERVRAVVKMIRSGNPGPYLFFSGPVLADTFHVRSFYRKSRTLRDYFLARRWYQVSRFLVRVKSQVCRGVLLARIVTDDPILRSLLKKLNSPWKKMVGLPADQVPEDWSRVSIEAAGRVLVPTNLLEKAGEIVRRLKALPLPLLMPYRDNPGLALFPAFLLGDSLHLQNAYEACRKLGRLYPSGLDLLCSGPLSSQVGKIIFQETFSKRTWLKSAMSLDFSWKATSLAGETLKALRLLQVSLPDSAPLSLRTLAWKKKQAWTQLGCWAEQKHNFVLHQAIPNYYTFGVDNTPRPPGYVSPYPKFFHAMGRVSKEISLWAGGMEKAILADGAARAALILAKGDWGVPWFGPKGPSEKVRSAARKFLSKRAVERGETLQVNEWKENRLWFHFVLQPVSDLGIRWKLFGSICAFLEEIARAELKGQAISRNQREGIKRYGYLLKKYCFSGAKADPKERSTKVVPVFSVEDRELGRPGGILYAGLGKPEALYVVVPWKGRSYLLLGGVLNYREFFLPIRERMDDRRWRNLLESGKAPPPPVFTKIFRPNHAGSKN